MRHVIRDLDFLNQIIEKYDKYLIAGKYRINPTKTIVYNERYKENAEKEGVFLYRVNLLKDKIGWIDFLFSRFYKKKVACGNKEFQGQIIMFTSSKKEVKIFNYDCGQVLTVYNETEKALDVINNRKYWAKYFPVVNFCVDLVGNGIKEELIVKEAFNSQDALSPLFQQYESYLMIIQQNGLLQKETIDISVLRVFLTSIERSEDYDGILDELSETKTCVTHGDLWASNLIFDGMNFYHIDFENLQNRVFYFDILMFVFSDGYLNHNVDILTKYIRGEYDVNIEKLFAAVHCKYSREKRMLYLEIVLYYLFRERWNNPSSVGVVNDIKNLIYELNRVYSGGEAR